jgi:hypothetical protein
MEDMPNHGDSFIKRRCKNNTFIIRNHSILRYKGLWSDIFN